MTMSRFNKWLNDFDAGGTKRRRMMAAAEPLVQPRMETRGEASLEIQWDRPGVVATVDARPPGVTREEWEEFRVWMRSRGDESDVFSTFYPLCGMFKGGPKVYCPTATEFRALTSVELRIPARLYRQPFETTVVAIPAGLYARPVVFCALRAYYQGDWMCLLAFVGAEGTSGDGDVMWSASFRDPEQTIEGRLKAVAANPHFEHLADPDDDAMTEAVKRATINACLLLANAGYQEGYDNPVWAAKLRDKAANRKLPPHVRELNTATLAALPKVLTFRQDTKVYRTAPGVEYPDRPPADPDRPPTIATHWRCGHWAHQPCGKDRAERKLIFREAVLVNPELIADPDLSVASYS